MRCRFLKSDWPASRIPTEVRQAPFRPRTAFTISFGDIPGLTNTLFPIISSYHLRYNHGEPRKKCMSKHWNREGARDARTSKTIRISYLGSAFLALLAPSR